MTNEHFTTEVMRAVTFFVAQYKKGWSPEEAWQQMKGSYGLDVATSAMHYVSDSLKTR